MSKAVLNQRYCYKLESSFIKRNKDNVKLTDIRQAIKNGFIVGIGDSAGTRMIRDIIGSKYNEEYINNIKREIKQTKKLDESDRQTRKKLKDLNKELLVACLQDRICNVVFNSNKDYEKYSKKGFKLNGVHYSLLIGTPGGIKLNTVMFIDERIREEVERRINNGADFDVPTMPSKLMAYKALTFSASTPVTYTPNILVVEDVEVDFRDKVVYIKFDDDKDAPTVEEIDDYKVVNNACDGCGLIRPSLADKWGQDLEQNYSPTAFVIRNSWAKGVLSQFDFEAYANSRDDMRGKLVKDVWGKEWDLKDVDIIMNRSMLKLSKHYKSLEEYLENCKKNGYGFSVTKYVHDEIDKERDLNYQYIQCLDLNNDDIDKLISKDVQEIREILGADYRKSILYGKGKYLNDKNVLRDINGTSYASILMVDGDCIKDSYIRERIRRNISTRIDLLKTGKISVSGNYQIAIGEPIIQMENMFGLEPKGLLKSKEFFIEYWRNLNVDRVGAFRSPMSCKQNAKIMNICHRDEVIKWYGHLENVIVFNAWDCTMSAMNGEDFDGDINFTTDNEILINGIYDHLPTIFCEGKSTEKIANATREQFIKSIKDGFGNKVGSVTNFGSSCYDKLALFEEGSEEYKELDYRIMCIQYLQQECIDSAKNGIPPKPIPNYWQNYADEKLKINYDEETGEILDDEETVKQKEFYNRVLTEKKPYYFRYIYNETNKEYKTFVKSMESNALRGFRKTIKELKEAENKTAEEQEFLEYYETRIPLSDNPCVVNIIAHKIEDIFDKEFTYSCKDRGFDYTQYMSDPNREINKKAIPKIIELFEEFKETIKSNILFKKKINDDDTKDRNIFNMLKTQLSEIIPNSKELTDTLIYIAYVKNKIGKGFVWNMVSSEILENLLSKNNNVINYPIRDDDGDITFNGEKFKMVSKIIN